jgi:two-component system, LuxR family, sensor kinase FixL
MRTLWRRGFAVNGTVFMPIGNCLLWRPGLLWLHVTSDACFGLSCCGIPFVLAYFIRKRQDLPFPFILWLFAAFILFCGAAHLLGIWVIWHPGYYAEGWIKAATAAISMATLGALVLYLPRGLEFVGTAQLTAQNARLSEQVEQSEERGRAALTAVVENVFDGIITIDEHGTIKSFNAACTRLFGYDPGEVIGKNVKMLMPSPYRGEHDHYLQSYLDTGIAKIIGTGGREVAGLRKDGTVFPLDLAITSFTIDGVRHFTSSMRDVTKQKAALDEREKLLARLTQSNAELERFAYVASHDMQEPARMMLSFSQLLQEEYASVLDQDGQDYLKIIGSSALRMRNMIRDLMDYARLDGERRTFLAVDLHQELAAVEENLSQLIAESGALITADPLPPVHGSAVQIMRLLQNLIINGIKYQPSGQTPRLHLGASEKDGQMVFYLRDNGLGIKPAFVEEIFEPFRRLHTWDSIQGSGLGLSVCRKIVEGHGGRIWASSSPGEGTTMFFTLQSPNLSPGSPH